MLIGFYLLPFRDGQYYTNLLNQAEPVLKGLDILIVPWANFDGVHYLNIAFHGYTNQARFFPLFPIILKIFSDPLIISVILVSVIFFLALYFFKKLIALDFPQKRADNTIIYLLVFPTSFFFVAIYSEGLFLLLALLAFYFARKKMWFLSIIFASLLMVTRFVGIAILPALLYEFVKTEGLNIRKALIFLISPLGIIAYSIFNFYKWDNFLYFIQSQGELGNNRTVSSVIFFPQTVFRYIKILSTVSIKSYDWSIAALELGVFLFAAIMLFVAWKKRIRMSYLIFAAINFAIITSTGTFSGLPRYVLTIFPVFMVLASIENRMLKIAYLVISPILLFILLMLFSRGYFVA